MKITVQGTMSDAEVNAVRYIFRDAFWEFIRAREGNYVERRYAEQSEAFKENKRNGDRDGQHERHTHVLPLR